MGRHSNGKGHYRISSWVIVAMLLFAALLGVGIWWFSLRSQTADSHQAEAQGCFAGTVEFSVFAPDNAQIADVINNYQAQNPIVQDQCVEVKRTDDFTQAAGAILTGSDDNLRQVLQENERSSATSAWPVAYTTSLGVFSKDASLQPSWNSLLAAGIAVPAKVETPMVDAGALLLTGDVNQAAALIRSNRQLTQEDAVAAGKELILADSSQAVPAGYTFIRPDETPDFPARFVPLTSTNNVSEAQVRAAEAFRASLAAANEQNSAATSEVALLLQADEVAAAVPVRAKDVLLLQDASSRIKQSVLPAVGETIAQNLPQDAKLSLWNFSSPLNPGVTKGWRQNADFGSPASALSWLKQLETDGDPRTREALLAAAPKALQQAEASGTPVRLILITTGTVDQISDDELRRGLDALNLGDKVVINMITIGAEADVDRVLADWVTAHGGTATVAADAGAVMQQLQQAFAG